MSPATVPRWAYRIGPLNWLMARPWAWDYRALYKSHRKVAFSWRTGDHTIAHGRLRSAWLALTFPHVHHPEDGFRRWSARVRWEPRDLWIGVFIKRERGYFLGPAIHFYICPLPTLLFHVVWIGKRDV